MGLFDTPAIVNKNILYLKTKDHQDFDVDIKFCDDGNIFSIEHDYFESPCYFRVIDWSMDAKNTPIFSVEWYPTNANLLKPASRHVTANKIDDVILQWEKIVNQIMQHEVLFLDPKLDSIREELSVKLGLTEENADDLIDEVQKKHAYQFCDQICEILDDLEAKDYDSDKIERIKFDLEKIKRDINTLKITTRKELLNGISNAWGKIKLAKVGKYLVDKTTDGIAGKLVGEIIDKIIS